MGRVPLLLHVFPSFGRGGTELRVARIINGIGNEFRHLIIPLDGNAEAAGQIRGDADARIISAPPRKGSVISAIALCQIFRRIGPDLVLTYNWGAIDAVVAALAARVCPVIHNESGFGPDEATRLKRRRVLARRLLLNRVHAVVANSRTLVQIALKDYGVHPEKVRFIRNGVDTQQFTPQRNEARRRELGCDETVVLFGSLGKHRKEKNLPLLIRAFAKADVSNAKLALFGDGPCRRELEELAGRLGLAGRVMFPGAVDDPASFLQACDAFAMSSLTEQTPNALLEAMACGLPAICTDAGDARELLDIGGMVAPNGDEEAFAAAIRTLAASGELRSRLGAANRQRCVTHYGLERMLREFANLYHDALTRRSG
jgi:glycosyltransferase involved in cell wall biosynthesis